jgi:hypothetical protein
MDVGATSSKMSGPSVYRVVHSIFLDIGMGRRITKASPIIYCHGPHRRCEVLSIESISPATPPSSFESLSAGHGSCVQWSVWSPLGQLRWQSGNGFALAPRGWAAAGLGSKRQRAPSFPTQIVKKLCGRIMGVTINRVQMRLGPIEFACHSHLKAGGGAVVWPRDISYKDRIADMHPGRIDFSLRGSFSYYCQGIHPLPGLFPGA